MYGIRTLKALVVSFTFFILATTAHAQVTRTWVSGVGDDVNPCSRTAPCKTFAGAISKTAAGGIINVLDPGGFGTVTITKSMTIEGPEKWGGILNSATSGVIVNAGASDTVVLRGLTINGGGTGLNGVRFIAGGSLTIEDCYIAGSATGVDFEPSGSSRLEMINTTVDSANTNAVLVQAGVAGAATASFEKVRLINSGFGVKVVKGVVSIKDSLISNIKTTAVKAFGSTTAAQITLDGSLVSDSGGGVNAAGAGSRIFMGQSTITNNTVGVSFGTGGVVSSFGNNRIIGNATDGSPTSTIAEH